MVPLMVPLDLKWGRGQLETWKACIEETKGVIVVELDDVEGTIQNVGVENPSDTNAMSGQRYSTRLRERKDQNPDFVKNWIANYTKGEGVAEGLSDLNLKNGNESAMVEVKALSTSISTSSASRPKPKLKCITYNEAQSHPRYKALFEDNTPSLLAIPTIPGKKQYSVMEAISLYMQVQVYKQDGVLKHWVENKFIPVDSIIFQQMYAAFTLQSQSIPIEWAEDWEAPMKELKIEGKQKEMDAIKRLIREGTVPVPPYPRTEFSPTEVAVILGAVKPREKTPIIEVWTKCGFVPVVRKTLLTTMRKYQNGDTLPPQYGMVGRNRLDGGQKMMFTKRKALTGEERRNHCSRSGASSQSKKSSAKEKLIEENGVPEPPDGKAEFSPLEAMIAFDAVNKSIQRYVATQWIKRNYIPVKRTALYNNYRAYKNDGKAPPNEWNAKGRPSKVDIDHLTQWAKDISREKGYYINEFELDEKMGVKVTRATSKAYWKLIRTALELDTSVPEGKRANDSAVTVQENMQLYEISHDDINVFL